VVLGPHGGARTEFLKKQNDIPLSPVDSTRTRLHNALIFDFFTVLSRFFDLK
jgi:hypothetical protein